MTRFIIRIERIYVKIKNKFTCMYSKYILYLLFISYKFVKGFLVITFLLFFRTESFKDVCQRFLYNQEQNFSLIGLG